MNDNEEEGRKFKIKDRRRFDAEGNPREENEEMVKDETPPKESMEESTTDSEADPNVSEREKGSMTMDIDFSSFIMSMATQALMQLGDMQPPPGIEVTVDPQAAKQSIDILTIIEEKTKGNLEPAEEKLLEEILHNLRMSFVRHQ